MRTSSDGESNHLQLSQSWPPPLQFYMHHQIQCHHHFCLTTIDLKTRPNLPVEPVQLGIEHQFGLIKTLKLAKISQKPTKTKNWEQKQFINCT